jgi:hypothetical protein
MSCTHSPHGLLHMRYAHACRPERLMSCTPAVAYSPHIQLRTCVSAYQPTAPERSVCINPEAPNAFVRISTELPWLWPACAASSLSGATH